MTCMNLVSFFPTGNPAAIRGALPGDCCHNHQTHEEDKAEDAALALFWQRLGVDRQSGTSLD